MSKPVFSAALLLSLLPLAACHERPDRDTVVVDIENSPTNLDIRIGSDAQAEHIGALLFDSIVRKDQHYNLQPAIATAWEWHDPLTLVLHIRDGVHFHDGKLLDASDVAWSIDSMHNGAITTAKGGNFASVDRAEVTDAHTCIVHLKKPDASLLFNMSDELSAVVEKGAGQNMGDHPIGTGPFRFVSEEQDKDVVLERNPNYWGGAPSIPRVRFAVVPDAITRALELQKGSADAASNALTGDMVAVMQKDPRLVVEAKPGSIVLYITFNATDPQLRDPRVRQAFAYAVDRPAIIQALYHGQAESQDTLLPNGHWAAPRANDSLTRYAHNIVKAKQLLEEGGYHADKNGTRIHLTLKSSTDDTMRLLAAVVQQQVRGAGIELSLRQNEFGTFYSDVTKGAFQMYVLRWVGSNEDPDIFRYAYSSAMMPPKGSNRGHYTNPRIDALIAQGAAEIDSTKRRAIYLELQRILSEDEPTLVLWSPDNIVVHSRHLQGVVPASAGSFGWLRTATLN
ncbi:ABC transporter substrate-binding protein [Terriglobus sp. TAA 43]|uniref:ABC transporter substrate-binding protein n=1 Tax=Terriglobus sp. TAA 43 TaxID=278961 RepID=UPI0006455BE5|nr:ABC transporter substrate-binding protein [Terriglobus sp. TAA 43]